MKQKTWFGGVPECWALLAIAASALLPWYGVQDDFNWLHDAGAIFSDEASANALLCTGDAGGGGVSPVTATVSFAAAAASVMRKAGSAADPTETGRETIENPASRTRSS